MTKDEALELALEVLETGKPMFDAYWGGSQFDNAITAVKEALAQPEQEPVGRFAKFTDGIWREVTDGSAGQPLYTNPPKREWVGLTDGQIDTVSQNYWSDVRHKVIATHRAFANPIEAHRAFARAIEAKLKEKNT